MIIFLYVISLLLFYYSSVPFLENKHLYTDILFPILSITILVFGQALAFYFFKNLFLVALMSLTIFIFACYYFYLMKKENSKHILLTVPFILFSISFSSYFIYSLF